MSRALAVRPVTDVRLIRRLPALVAAAATLLFLVVAALAGAPPAAAADDECAKKVIADWYDNGRVDQIYELQCYRDAVKALPVDVRDYSSAKDDILRALLFAQQGTTDPGSDGAGSDDDGSGSGDAGSGGTGSGGTGSGGTDGTAGGDPTTPPVAPQVDTAGPSSIPVPLLVLAGLATLLLALGAAGYLTRRRGTQPGDEPPTPV